MLIPITLIIKLCYIFTGDTKSIFYSHERIGKNGKVFKYPAIRPPGAKGFFRFHKLGEGFALDEILDRVNKNYRRTLPFPEEEQEKVRRYREKTRPKAKLKGLHALYIRYCYELHIIQKFPASVKRVSFFMREDLTRMDKLDEQTRFLAENRIETKEDLDAFRSKAVEEIDTLTDLRKNLRNELKRVLRNAPDEVSGIRERIGKASEEIKKNKRGVFLCDCIEARSEPMEKALEELTGEQKIGKEEKANEQLLGRGGRTGREDVAGRR